MASTVVSKYANSPWVLVANVPVRLILGYQIFLVFEANVPVPLFRPHFVVQGSSPFCCYVWLAAIVIALINYMFYILRYLRELY